MNKTILVILTLLCLIAPGSADTNITIQIYEDSSGDYFISVNDDGLEECQGSTCNITIENETLSKYSDSEMKDIARYISMELDIPENTGCNTTETYNVFTTVIEEMQMNDRAWISKTWMPETMKYHNCTLELNQTKGALNTLDAKFAGYDATIQSKDEIITTIKQTKDLYLGFTVVLGIAVSILILYINGVFDVLMRIKRRR